MPRGLNHDINEAIEALYDLHVGVMPGPERHERPHKPILLLAVLDLMAQGKATPDRIPWSAELRSRFRLYFDRVHKHNDQCTPENPFLYLRQEKWWQPLRLSARGEHPIESTPTAADALAGTVSARITPPLSSWLIRPEHRLRLRDAIIARYFPQARDRLLPLFQEASVMRKEPAIESAAEDAAAQKPGRSSGFRRKILEIYDCQCAACGLRIKLPQIDDLTFVDAAHLIPFEVGRDDHPSNGIALCKNHHWAMDRFLIAPSPAGVWQVSKTLVARRSPGEKELLDLQNEPVLKPSEEAFYPAETALIWRFERLAA